MTVPHILVGFSQILFMIISFHILQTSLQLSRSSRLPWAIISMISSKMPGWSTICQPFIFDDAMSGIELMNLVRQNKHVTKYYIQYNTSNNFEFHFRKKANSYLLKLNDNAQKTLYWINNFQDSKHDEITSRKIWPLIGCCYFLAAQIPKFKFYFNLWNKDDCALCIVGAYELYCSILIIMDSNSVFWILASDWSILFTFHCFNLCFWLCQDLNNQPSSFSALSQHSIVLSHLWI